MNRRTNDARLFRSGSALALLVLVGLGSGRADAASIQSNRLIPATEANLGPRWTRFLAAGPSVWSRIAAPPFRSYLTLPRVNGQLVDSPFLGYLLWRRSFNPTRFDFYHPNVARELAAALTPTPTPPIAQVVTPRTPTPPTTNPQPQTVVPEPQSLCIGLVLAAGALAWRVRRPGKEGRLPTVG